MSEVEQSEFGLGRLHSGLELAAASSKQTAKFRPLRLYHRLPVRLSRLPQGRHLLLTQHYDFVIGHVSHGLPS